MSDFVPLGELSDLAMGETIIAGDCDGLGFPIFSADTRDAPWNWSSKIRKVNAAGTIVVGARGSIGFPRLPKFDGFGATQTTITVIPNKIRISPEYLYYSLCRFDFKAVSAQQAVPMLTVAELGGLLVRYLPLEEQRQIAKILDTLDTAINETEAIITKLNAIKLGLLNDLLKRGIDHNGELRPPQAEAPHLYKESTLGWIPKEWEFLALSKRLRRITYGFTNPMPTTDEGPWMLTATDISGGTIQYSTARHTNVRAFQQLSAKSRPELGDVLVTKDGTLGRVAVVDRLNICVNQSVAVLSPIHSIDSTYLSIFLQSPIGQDRMMADAGGSTIKHLYITKIADMEIPWPREGEAAGIVEKISELSTRIAYETQLLNKFKQEKSGLMDDLLTGRVCVAPLLAEAEHQPGSD